MNIKKILSFAIGPIGAAALGLISVPLIAWFFSPEDVGRMSLVVVITSFCNLVFTLGLDQAYVREYHESDDKQSLLKMTFFPGFSVLVFVSLFVSLFCPNLLLEYLHVSSEFVVFLIVAYVITVFISRYVTLILRMEGKGFAYSFSQLLPKLFLLIALGIYFLFLIKPAFWLLLLANFFALVITTILFITKTKNEWRGALLSKIEPDKLRAMLKFGTPLIFASSAFWGMTSLDRLFLRHYVGFEELGIYSVAVNFAGVAIILQSVFSTVWSPMVYKWVADGDDLDKVFNVTHWMVAIIGLFFSLAGLFSWLIPYILPAKFSEVQYIFVACLGYPLFYTLSETTVVGINITKKTKFGMLAAVIALSVNIVCNYLFVPLYGAKGAAIATAFSFWVFFVCRTEFSSRVWKGMEFRGGLYFITFFYVLLVMLFALFGDSFFIIFICIFLLIAFLCSLRLFFLFKNVGSSDA